MRDRNFDWKMEIRVFILLNVFVGLLGSSQIKFHDFNGCAPPSILKEFNIKGTDFFQFSDYKSQKNYLAAFCFFYYFNY